MPSIEALKRRLQEIQDTLASLPKVEEVLPSPATKTPPEALLLATPTPPTSLQTPPSPIPMQAWKGFGSQAFAQAILPEGMGLGAREETQIWVERDSILLGDRLGRCWVVVDPSQQCIGHFEGLAGGIRGISRWENGWIIGTQGGFTIVDLLEKTITHAKIDGLCWTQMAGGGLLLAVKQGAVGVSIWGSEALDSTNYTLRGELHRCSEASLSRSGRWVYAVTDKKNLIILDIFSSQRVEWIPWDGLPNPSIDGFNYEESHLFIRCRPPNQSPFVVALSLAHGELTADRIELSSENQKFFYRSNAWQLSIDREKIQFYKYVEGRLKLLREVTSPSLRRMASPSASLVIHKNQSIDEDLDPFNGLPIGRLYVFNSLKIEMLDLSQWPARSPLKVEGGLLGVHTSTSGEVLAVCAVRSLALVRFEARVGHTFWEHKPSHPVTAAYLEPTQEVLWWCEGGPKPCLYAWRSGNIEQYPLPHAAYVVSVHPRTGWVVLGFAPGEAWLALWQFKGPLAQGPTTKGHLDLEAPPRGLGFSADGRWMASGTTEGHMLLWDLEADEGGVCIVGQGQRAVGSVMDLWRDATVNREGALFTSEGGEVCRVGFNGFVEVGLVKRGPRCVSGVGAFGRWWVRLQDGLGSVMDLERFTEQPPLLLTDPDAEGLCVDGLGGVVVVGAGWVERWEARRWSNLQRRLATHSGAAQGGKEHRLSKALFEQANGEVSEDDARLLNTLARLLATHSEMERLRGIRALRRKMQGLANQAEATEPDPLGWLDGDMLNKIQQIEARPLAAFLAPDGFPPWKNEELKTLSRLAPLHAQGGKCAVFDELAPLWAWEGALSEALAWLEGGPLGVDAWLQRIQCEEAKALAAVLLTKCLIGSYKNWDILKIQRFIRDSSCALSARSRAVIALRSLELSELFESELVLFVSDATHRQALGETMRALQTYAQHSGL